MDTNIRYQMRKKKGDSYKVSESYIAERSTRTTWDPRSQEVAGGDYLWQSGYWSFLICDWGRKLS